MDGARSIPLRPALLALTGDVEAALLLQQLCYWTSRTRDIEGWIYKSADELATELGRLPDGTVVVSPSTIRRRLRVLETTGLVHAQDSRDPFDRTKIYRVAREIVEIDRAVEASRGPSSIIAASKSERPQAQQNPSVQTGSSGEQTAASIGAGAHSSEQTDRSLQRRHYREDKKNTSTPTRTREVPGLDLPETFGRPKRSGADEQLDALQFATLFWRHMRQAPQHSDERWLLRFKHVCEHWSPDELREALEATAKIDRPSWAYLRGCLEASARRSADAAAKWAIEKQRQGKPAEYEPATTDQFPDLDDEALLELAGEDVVHGWWRYLIDHQGFVEVPVERCPWLDMIADELRTGGIRPPPTKDDTS